MDNGETAEEKLETIANTTDLATAIKRLERRKAVMEEELKDSLSYACRRSETKKYFKKYDSRGSGVN